jgi:putative hydrolase of the HAD superfamily
MSPGVLWWDFDGTLVSRPVMWAEVALRLLDREVPDHGVPVESMTALVFAGMPWHRLGHAHPELTSPDLWWAAVFRRYVEVFTELGYPSAASPPALAALRADILDASAYVVFDDVRPALIRARANGWRSLMVSNHVPELEMLVRDLGMAPFFESVVSSGVVGYEKPHARLFEAALRQTGPARPVWMIGDNPDADCSPVCAIGHQAVLVRSPVAGAFERQAADLNAALDLIEASA